MNDTGQRACLVCGGPIRSTNTIGICQRTRACKCAHAAALYYAGRARRPAPPPCQACGKPLHVRRADGRFHRACRDDPAYKAAILAVMAAERRERQARRREREAAARRERETEAERQARLSALAVSEVEAARQMAAVLLGRLAGGLAALEAKRAAEAARERKRARGRKTYQAQVEAQAGNPRFWANVEKARVWREAFEEDRRRRGIPENGLLPRKLAGAG